MKQVLKYIFFGLAILIVIVFLWDLVTINSTYWFFLGYLKDHFNLDTLTLKAIAIIISFIFIVYVIPNLYTVLNPLKPINAKARSGFIITSFVSSLLLLTAIAEKGRAFDAQGNSQKCVAWAIDHYEEVPCYWTVHPKFGTPVVVLNSRLANLLEFRKIRPSKVTQFFNPINGKALIYYYRDSLNQIDFFNMDGYHPQYGVKLRPVTKDVIEDFLKTSNYWNTGKQVDSLQRQLKNY